MPIFVADATIITYEMVKKHLDTLGKDTGYDFEFVELQTYQEEENVMHPFIIRPVLK